MFKTPFVVLIDFPSTSNVASLVVIVLPFSSTFTNSTEYFPVGAGTVANWNAYIGPITLFPPIFSASVRGSPLLIYTPCPVLSAVHSILQCVEPDVVLWITSTVFPLLFLNFLIVNWPFISPSTNKFASTPYSFTNIFATSFTSDVFKLPI